MTIVAVMTTAVVPMFAHSVQWVRGDRAKRDLIAHLKYGQERAITDGTEYRLYLDDKNDAYWLVRLEGIKDGEKVFQPVEDIGGERRTLSQGVDLVKPTARRDTDKKSYYVGLYPTGACDYATITLVKPGGRTVRIETKGKLGRFQVREQQ